MGGTLVALLLLASFPAPAGAQEPASLPPLGISMNAVQDMQAAGAGPRYGSYWVGPWMATSGWGGLDNALRTAVSTGTTPVVYWYYWGDSISPSCVENGCDGRSKAQWSEMTTTLAQHLRDELNGREVLVVLENEFNKGGITDASYAPTFDGHLEKVALELKGVPGVKIVLGFGAWGESAWTRFPKAAGASEYIGFQMMRASTKDTEAQYRAASDRISYLTGYIATKFNKPSFLYDLALSSYPDAKWEQLQAEELDDVFRQLSSAGASGLQGVVYRTLKDNPNMGLHNYYGYAERHWGLWTADGVRKPSWNVWLSHATAGKEPAPAPAPNAPGAFEAESMEATKGGRTTQSHFSGGAGWNLWSNGELRQTLSAAEAFTARVTVAAQGQAAGGVDPVMEIRLDGAKVATFSVASGKLGQYTAELKVPAGASTLAVAYTNDAIVNGEDRNLLVDRVDVAAAPVNRAPVASFAAQTDGLSVSVDASASSDADGDALAYAWSFGDGATASGATASHAYASPGTYTVTLTVSDGKSASSASRQATAVQPNRAPSASFSVSGGFLEFAFDASASSDADGDMLAYAWSFGDGATASGATATHSYAAPGNHTVTLTVSDGKAATSASQQVTAVQPNRAPSASFVVSGANFTFAFDASSSSDADGDALTYAWDFGDGATGEGVTASHVYAAPGAYTVTLTVGDGDLSGATATTVTAVQPNRAPRANLSVSEAKLDFAFDGSGSSDPDGDALAYEWDFGDGARASGAAVSHSYAKGGAYNVTLTVRDAEYEDRVVVQVVAVEPNRAPVAALAAQGANLTFRFDASGSTDADGDALTYVWDFGDGRNATGVSVSHTYAKGGTYTVTLTVRDAELSDVATRSLVAVKPNEPPTAAFAAKGANLTFSFDASASSDPDGDPLTYAWSFGDGTTATGRTATRTYAKAGNYTVTLTVDDGRGLRATAARTVEAKTPPPPPAPKPAPVAVEAESFERKDNGQAYKDAAASGGRAWLLWSNGAASQTVAPVAGAYAVEVVAKGDHASGWPAMELRVDGALVQTFTVDSASWKSFTTLLDFDGKSRVVSLHFTNDHFANGEDRNLRLDAVRLTPVVAKPQSFDGEAFERRDNGASFSHASASGGQVWMLWANGGMSQSAQMERGEWDVQVVAVGDECNGRPVMEVRLDGALLGRTDVAGGTLAKHTFRASVASSGAHVLSVHFTNDHRTSGCDRNLRVDLVSLVPR